MKSFLLLPLALGLLIAGTPVGASLAQQKSPPAVAPLQTGTKTAQLIARLEQDVPPLMAAGDVPGLALALVRDGKVVYEHGFGVTNSKTKAPVTNNTVFEAASLSKPVFAYAVLKLVDSGKFDLDKPLQEYLPGDYDVGPDPRLQQITARRVLSHTTGFPNWRPNGGPLKIHFTPGEKFSYSGEGFVYLSKVIEHVTGEKFNDFMKRMVFEPLGMSSSSYLWQDGYDNRVTFRHNSLGDPTGQNKPRDASVPANAAASLRTTAQDYGRFIAAVMNGTGLKRETLAQMLTPQIKVDEGGANTTTRLADHLSPTIAWGLGWGLQSTPDGLWFWHWGDNGDSKAYIVAFPKQKFGVVVFANSNNGLSIMPEIVSAAVGGAQPALAWLKYESYQSPGRRLLKTIVAGGAETALRQYREQRRAHPDQTIEEAAVNQMGYTLLYGLKRPKDAIEVFKLNVEDHPQSANTYDSLGEAYMVAGDKELAIKNYQRSVELNPNNTNGVEALKKLRETANN